MVATAAMFVLAGIARAQTSPAPADHVAASRPGERKMLSLRGDAVMGTRYLLKVCVPSGQEQRGAKALQAALAAARRVEAAMSTYITGSQLSRLNASAAGEHKVGADLLAVLKASQTLYQATDGAFDVTIQPIILLYRTAGKTGTAPTDEQLRKARAASRWTQFALSDGAVRKRAGSASFNLGGIAKGFAIDAAIHAMQAAGVEGGLVEIGGDISAFGRKSDDGPWVIAVRNPFYKVPGRDGHPRPPFLSLLTLRTGAVCTSGNYERAVTIHGKTYSHIIDPVDPTRKLARDFTPSVTVYALDATTADAWATALSVLGPKKGMALLNRPANRSVLALFVTGGPDDYQTIASPALEKMLHSATPTTRPTTQLTR